MCSIWGREVFNENKWSGANFSRILWRSARVWLSNLWTDLMDSPRRPNSLIVSIGLAGHFSNSHCEKSSYKKNIHEWDASDWHAVHSDSEWSRESTGASVCWCCAAAPASPVLRRVAMIAMTTKKWRSIAPERTVDGRLASNQAQPLLIWWRRDLGLGASKNRRICNHYVFKVVSQNLADRQRVVYTWADVGPGAERHNSHRCTCMLTILNSEKTLVLYVLRLGRFVSSMSWCLESALRRCELRHSVTLKAELRRSIEVVLAGHHFVADLSTWFREVTDLSAASFCFDGTRVVAHWYC